MEEIKQKATSWTPKEVENNHMRHRSAESIKRSMGHLGMSPRNPATDFMAHLAHGAFDVFHEITTSLGLKKEEVHRLKQAQEESDSQATDPADDEFPREFSWRKERPECLGLIEDQGECGSCWAFTSAGLLSDRFCIHTNGAIKERLSAQEMVNCNYENYGCLGGYLITSIDYLVVEGAVT